MDTRELFANEWTARDEGVHTDFANYIYALSLESVKDDVSLVQHTVDETEEKVITE